MPEDMTREELKRHIIVFLKGKAETQVDSVMEHLERMKANAEMTKYNEGQVRYSGPIVRLTAKEETVALELLHRFTISGIIIPSLNRRNTGWPWIRVTDYGKEALAQEEPSPYDVEGYLASLKDSISSLDEVVATYVSEGLRCLEYQCVFAAAFLLGGASQRLIQLLGSSMCGALKEEEHRKKFEQKLGQRDISKVFESMKGKLGDLEQQLPEDLTRDFDYHIGAIFTFIRLTRNEVGHPRDDVPDIAYTGVYADYHHFPKYAGKIYELIEYFEANPQSL